MSRFEEHAYIVLHLEEEAKKIGSGPFEEIVAWQLGTMNTLLTDIAASLAIIADRMEE